MYIMYKGRSCEKGNYNKQQILRKYIMASPEKIVYPY